MHFFGTSKNPCNSKFVQLLLLENRLRAGSSKTCEAQGFHYINRWTKLETVFVAGGLTVPSHSGL